jgi:hypothetical protein
MPSLSSSLSYYHPNSWHKFITALGVTAEMRPTKKNPLRSSPDKSQWTLTSLFAAQPTAHPVNVPPATFTNTKTYKQQSIYNFLTPHSINPGVFQ